MSDFSDEERAALRKLVQRVESDPAFSGEELKALREVLMVYEGLRAWGQGARWIVMGLAALAAAVTAWEVLSAKVRAWFGG